METTPPVPLQATLTFTVTADDTAGAVGSGDLPVLGTPRLLAWFEAVCCAALHPSLEAGDTSVGTRVSMRHVAPSGVGRDVVVTASVVNVDGRVHRFAVSARHLGANGAEADAAGGPVVGDGELTRIVVDAEKFLARLG